MKSTVILGAPFNHIPGPKPLPFIYNIWRYFPLIGDYKLDTLYENAQYNKSRYGSIVREQITKQHTILHLFEPNDIETLIRQDGKYPHRRSHRALLKYRRERPNLYNDAGLFPENGPNWYRNRNLFQQRMLSKSQVLKNTQKLDQVSLSTIRDLKMICQATSGQILNFQSILYRWALANSLSLFLDLDSRKLDGKLIEQVLQNLDFTLSATDKTEIQTERWVRNPSKCPHYKLLVASQDFLHNFVSSRIQDQTFDCPDQVSYLRDWLSKDKLDRRDVVTFIIDSLLAGLHTTSYTAAFLIYHLAKNPHIQESVRREVNEYSTKSQPITGELIDKFMLLKNCLKETMRLNPVSIGTGRLTQSSISIRDYEIPKDTMIITQNQVISRDENVYSSPGEFRPERWTEYRSCPRHARPSPFATLPFGFGARSCIGQRIAELQIKILTIRLLQYFQITSFDEILVKTTLIHNIKGSLTLRLNMIQ